MSDKSIERLLYLVSPIGLLVAWQLMLMAGFGDRRFIPAPSGGEAEEYASRLRLRDKSHLRQICGASKPLNSAASRSFLSAVRKTRPRGSSLHHSSPADNCNASAARRS